MSDLKSDMVYYRARERITQGELAKRCGLSMQTVMNVENGKKLPSKLTYAKIRMVVKERKEQ